MTKPLHVSFYGSKLNFAAFMAACERVFLLISLFLFSITSVFAATKTWTGATNSDWNTGSNWGGTAPAAGDIANIPGGLTNYPVINNTVTIATVNINSAGSGASITLTTGGTFNVTTLLTVNANGSFIQNGGTSNLAALTSNNLVTFSGGTLLATGTITINNGATLNQSGGLIHLAVNTGTNPTDNILIATGGTITQSDGTLYIKDFAAGGGTFNQTGANALLKVFHDWKPGAGSTFNSTAGTVEFTGSGGGGPNFAAGTRQFSNIIIDAGADPVFSNAAGSTFTITGDLTNNNSTLAAQTDIAITFNGTGTQTVTTAAPANALASAVTINKSSGTFNLGSGLKIGSLTLTAGSISTTSNNYSLTATGNVLFSAGTFNMNASTIAVTGSWTNNGCTITGGACTISVTGDHTWTAGSLSAPTGTFALSGNFVNNAGGTFDCPLTLKGAAKTISGSNNFVFTTLTIFDAATYTMNVSGSCSSLTFAVSANASSFTLGSGTVLTANGDITINQPSAAKIIALNINTGTINVTGNVNIGGNNTTNGRIAKIVVTTGTLHIIGNLVYNCAATVAANSVVDMSGGAGLLILTGNITLSNGAGTLTPGTTSTVEFYGTAAQTIAGGSAISYNHIKINKTSGTVTQSTDISAAGNLQIDQGGYSTGASNYALDVGSFVLNGGSLNMNASTITASGSYSNSGCTVTGGACSITISGDFTRTAGSFNAASATVTVGGNWTNNNSSTAFNAGSVTFTGATKTIGGTYATDFPLLNISSGGITANTNFTGTSLTLTNNALANSLTLANGVTASINGDVTINQSTANVIHALNINAATFTVNGNVVINVTANNSGRVAKIVITTGTLTVTGNITMTNALLAANSVIDMSGGAGNLYLGGNFNLNTLGTLTTGTASTIHYNGSGSQAVAALGYNYLVINKPAGTASLAGGINVTNITLTQGTLNGVGSGYYIAVAGNWTNNGGTYTSAGATVYLTGAGNVGGTTSTTFGGLNVYNTATAYTMSNDNSCTSLTLDIATAALSFSHSGSANLTVNGPVTINQPSATATEAWNINAGTATVSGLITFAGTNTTVSRIGKIVITTGTLNAFGGITFTASANATKVIDMAGGAGSLNLKGALTAPALSGTLTAGTAGSTFNYSDAAAQTINYFPAGAYHNLHINNTNASGATLSAAVTTTNVTGNISVGNVNPSSTFVTGNFAIALNNSKTVTVASGSTLDAGTSVISFGTGAPNLSIAGTFKTANLNGFSGAANTAVNSTNAPTYVLTGSTIEYNASSGQTVTQRTDYHNIIISNGSKTIAAGTFTLAGSLTINSGATWLGSTNNPVLNIAGDFSNSGTFTQGTALLTLNGTGAQAIGGSTATAFNDITISNTAAAVSSSTSFSVASSKTFTLNAGTVFTPAAAVIISGAGTLTGSGVAQVTRTAATADFCSQYTISNKTLTNLTIDYSGAGDQSICAASYVNLKASGSGTKTATGNLGINGTLTITSGVTVDMVTYTLSGTLATLSGTGTLKTQNTSATPIPSGKTWPFGVFYSSSSAQTVVGANYADLNGTGGNRTLPSGTTGIAGTFTPGAGAYTTTGSTIDFNGAAQSIPAFAFESVSFSNGNTKTIGGNISVTNVLTLGANTTLSLSHNITLKSSSTNTARIAQVPTTASISYGSGKFVVERYIPGRRRYRLITSSVTTSALSSLSAGQEGLSIWGNWQASGSSSSNVGTIITGGTSGDGFDQHTTNASMYTYDAVNRRYNGFSSANSKNTKYTPLKAGVAYYLFVYGDRTNTVYTSTPNNTTISASGTILYGDQTYNTGSTIPLSNVTDRYTMLGNPFASPINWATIQRTNLYDTYWGWDPNLNNTGGYITVTSAGGVTLISPYTGTPGLNQYIQPGQGFFVRTSAANPVLTIREQDKSGTLNLNAFRTTNSIPLIAANLYYTSSGNEILADGALAAFDPNYSVSVGREDAAKMVNNDETVAFENQNNLLSIDARPIPTDKDSLPLNMSNLAQQRYTLVIFSQQLDSNLNAYLVDRYLHTSQPLSLSDTNRIAFDINSDPSSSQANRFMIIFKGNGLPVPVIGNKRQIEVYPNPLAGQQMNIRFSGVPKGLYRVRLVNSTGQQVMRQLIIHDGNDSIKQLWLTTRPAAGVYQLQVVSPTLHFNKAIVIQ